MKTKKFVGYVPKGETIQDTVYQSISAGVIAPNFGMYPIKKDILKGHSSVVKRTITLSWEDEPVKEKK